MYEMNFVGPYEDLQAIVDLFPESRFTNKTIGRYVQHQEVGTVTIKCRNYSLVARLRIQEIMRNYKKVLFCIIERKYNGNDYTLIRKNTTADSLIHEYLARHHEYLARHHEYLARHHEYKRDLLCEPVK